MKEKLGIIGTKKTIEELKDDLLKVRMAMKEVMGLTDEECDGIIAKEMEKRTSRGVDDRNALESVVRSLRAQVRGEKLSTAATFDGYIIGDRGVYDRTSKLRQQALAEYERNAKLAIQNEIVDIGEDGKPIVLDTRELMFGRPNPRKGKPLLPEYTRTLYGIATKRPNGSPKVFRLQVRDKVATEQVPPLFEPVTFRANIGVDAAELELRHSNRTRFTKSSAEMPSVEEILESDILDGYTFRLNELPEAAQKCASDWSFFIVTIGDVLSVGSKTDRGTIPVTIGDDSLPDETRTVWVPEHLEHLIDFGVGSRIVVTGRARETSFNEQVVYSINADGIYAIPYLKTDPGSIFESLGEE